MDRSKGGRPELTNTQEELVNPKPVLSDLGITPKQSSQWQKVANVPEDEFERHIAVDTAKGKAPSSGVGCMEGNQRVHPRATRTP